MNPIFTSTAFTCREALKSSLQSSSSDRSAFKPVIASDSVSLRFGTNTRKETSSKLGKFYNWLSRQYRAFKDWFISLFSPIRRWYQARQALKAEAAIRAREAIIYKLDNFQVPEGLETPEQRRAKTVAIVSRAYPRMLELYQGRENNPDWKKDVERAFNEALRQELSPSGPRVGCDLAVNFERDQSSGEYVSHFEVRKTPSEKSQGEPYFSLGRISLDLFTGPDDEEFKARFHGLLLHETSHLVSQLAQHPKNNLSKELLQQYKGLQHSIYYREFGSSIASLNRIQTAQGQAPFPVEMERARATALHKLKEHIDTEKLSQFVKVFEQMVSQDEHSLLMSPNYLKTHQQNLEIYGLEKMLRYLEISIKNEYEATLAELERLSPDNSLTSRTLFLEDFNAIIGRRFYEQVINYFAKEMKS